MFRKAKSILFVALTIVMTMVSFLQLSGQNITSKDYFLMDDPSCFSIQFDNDTYYYTDYYYTNGFEAKIKLPVFSKVPWTVIVPKAKGAKFLNSELIISQRLYTPKNIRDTLVQFNDRPFSATLELAHRFLSSNENGISFMSTIRLGIMGPAAGGEALQRLIHDWINSPDPKGWDYQIKNGVIINYDLLMSYSVINHKSIDLSLIASARAGTLYDDLGAGVDFGISNFRKSHSKKVKYYLTLGAMTKLVGYNALLQGGLTTNNNPYVLSYGQVTPVVFSASLSAGISWYGVALGVEHNYLSKEFDTGTNHNYASIKLAYQF